MIYNDGLVMIIGIGAIYSMEVFGFTIEEAMLWGLAAQVTAGLGAFAMGFLDDRIGGKKTILISLVGLSLAVLWATLARAESATSLYLAGFIIGIFMGPNQAASRSLLGRFVPAEKETEFYGFFAFSGRATSFWGFAIYAGMTTTLGSPRRFESPSYWETSRRAYSIVSYRLHSLSNPNPNPTQLYLPYFYLPLRVARESPPVTFS